MHRIHAVQAPQESARGKMAKQTDIPRTYTELTHTHTKHTALVKRLFCTKNAFAKGGKRQVRTEGVPLLFSQHCGGNLYFCVWSSYTYMYL